MFAFNTPARLRDGWDEFCAVHQNIIQMKLFESTNFKAFKMKTRSRVDTGYFLFFWT